MPDRADAAILLLRGRIGPILRWARRGPIALWVVPTGDWTLLSPAEDETAANPVDPIAALGGRPIPPRLRPALFLLAQKNQLIGTSHGPRTEPCRWLNWSPGIGQSEVAPQTPATPSTLVHLLGDGSAQQRTALRQALAAEHPNPAAVAELILTALHLPGTGFATGQLRPHRMSDAHLVTATAWEIAS